MLSLTMQVLTMQETAHAAGTPTAQQGGPLRDPLE
jgi:hypothetical protein